MWHRQSDLIHLFDDQVVFVGLRLEEIEAEAPRLLDGVLAVGDLETRGRVRIGCGARGEG